MPPRHFSKLKEATDFIFQTLGTDIRLATPLGLGKPNQLLNGIYDRAKSDPERRLKIYTALSLQPPKQTEELGRRFLEPFAEKHWGNNYPSLRYSLEAINDTIPDNIQVHEFYFQAGSALRSKHLQRHYQSINYTHVAENVFRSGINLIVQLIAKRDGKYSLSSNPDVTLDLIDLHTNAGRKITVVGVVHPDLPFLGGDAEVSVDLFDAIVESAEVNHELFALPRQPISFEDHLIGTYASQLVRDEGTLQIGIGSLSDAVVSALVLRQKENSLYQDIVGALPPVSGAYTQPLVKGLYGLTEMLTDGFMHLRKNGILKRKVIDDQSGRETYLHGSFILGSKTLYDWLRDLDKDEASGLRMSRVSKVNDLYDPNETRLRAQRIHPRFFNTTMQVSLLGEAMSETLNNGLVVSGVGGQYNFVAMSHELKDSHSIIMLRSTRVAKGQRVSNLVWKPGHSTIPRHLRDIVITEYGIAELRGKTDEECIKSLLAICDSEFQDDLLKQTKADRKITEKYEIPDEFRNNTPEFILSLKSQKRFLEAFKPFPFGSDFTIEEERIALALSRVQEDKNFSMWKLLKKTLASHAKAEMYTKELERMQLVRPRTVKEHLYRKILLAYLDDK